MSIEIELKVRRILSEAIDGQKDVNIIGLEDNLSEVGLNSISFIKVVVGIESEFGFEFYNQDLDINGFINLKELINYIEERIF